MLRVKNFKLSDFLNKVQDRGGDVSAVFYTFQGVVPEQAFIRQIKGFSKMYSRLSAIDFVGGRKVDPRPGFADERRTVRIEEYITESKRLMGKKKGVLIYFL